MAYKQREKKEHAFKSFARDLKEENIPEVLFLYGEERYLIDWTAETLASRYVNPTSFSLDYVKFKDEGETAKDIIEACNTFSMLSERRIVWADRFAPLRSGNVRGFGTEELKILENYIREPNAGTILIFSEENPEAKSELVKLLKKESRCYCFDQLDLPAIRAFILKRFKEAGMEIEIEKIQKIIEQSGYFHKESQYRILNLVHDIEKMVAYSGGEYLTEEDIAAVLDGDMDKFIFDLLDAVSNNEKDKAFTLLYNILGSGRDVFSVTAMLINQFELLLDVAQCKEEGMGLSQITAFLKSSEFRVKKAMRFAERFTIVRLKEILSQLYEIDRNIKTGVLEPELALEMVIGRV